LLRSARSGSGIAPQLFARTRGESAGQLLAVDQPFRLRVAATSVVGNNMLRVSAPGTTFRPSLMPGLPSYRKISAVAKVVVEVLRDKGPVPTTSSGALLLANILHLNSVNPDDHDLAGVEAIRVEGLPQLDDGGHGDPGAEQHFAHPVP